MDKSPLDAARVLYAKITEMEGLIDLLRNASADPGEGGMQHALDEVERKLNISGGTSRDDPKTVPAKLRHPNTSKVDVLGNEFDSSYDRGSDGDELRGSDGWDNPS